MYVVCLFVCFLFDSSKLWRKIVHCELHTNILNEAHISVSRFSFPQCAVLFHAVGILAIYLFSVKYDDDFKSPLSNACTFHRLQNHFNFWLHQNQFFFFFQIFYALFRIADLNPRECN